MQEKAACVAVDDAGISRKRAQRHDPGFGIDPLDSGPGEKPDRASAGLNLADRLSERDLERKPDHINRPCDPHDRQDLWEALEQHVESKPDDGDHEPKAQDHTSQMRQGGSQAIFYAGCHQHQVVRSGRDSGDEGERSQRPKDFRMNGQRGSPQKTLGA